MLLTAATVVEIAVAMTVAAAAEVATAAVATTGPLLPLLVLVTTAPLLRVRRTAEDARTRVTTIALTASSPADPSDRA
jgi:ACR3 family arsenite efflux pump ArsB